MDYTYQVPQGLIYRNQILLTGVQDVLPEGEFLLPICTTRERLQKMLSVLWEEREALPEIDDDPFSGANVSSIEHIMDVLQALAYIDDPENSDCYAPEQGDGNDCTLFMPDAGFINYAPNDPFQTPDLVPPGYLFVPPWYTNPAFPLTGVRPTDAMVNFLALSVFGDLVSAAESGLPRFHMDVIGEGEVELEFVKIPQGGNVIVIQDGDPLQQQVYDLNALQLGELGTLEDLFDIVVAESLDDTSVCEVRFDTPGLHSIDVTFFPNVAADVIVGMGGGLRRVSLCGVSLTGEVDMPQFQVVDCVLQWRPNSSAAWADLVDLCAVQPPTIVRQDQTPPGNLEQNIAGAGFTEIANTDFFWRNGLYDIVGQTRIKPPVVSTVPLRMYAAPASAEGVALWEGFNPAGQKVISFSGTNQATQYYGADPTRSLQYYQTSGNSVIQNNGTDNKLLIAAISNIGLNYGNQQGVSIGVSAPTENALLTLWANSATKRGIFIRNRDDSSDAFKLVNDSILMRARITNEGAAEFYQSLKLRLLTSTTRENVASLVASWDDSTFASRKGRFTLSADAYNGSREILAGRNDAAQAMIGVLGAPPQPRLAVSGDWQGNEAGKHLTEAFALFGWIIDDTTLGTPYAPTPFAVTGDRQGNTALTSLISGGDTEGLWVDETTDLEFAPTEPVDMRCQAAGVAGWIGAKWYSRSATELFTTNSINPLDELNSVVNVHLTGLEFGNDILLPDNFRDWWLSYYANLYAILDPGERETVHLGLLADHLEYFNTVVSSVFYNHLPATGILDLATWLLILDDLFADNYTDLSIDIDSVSIGYNLPNDTPTWVYHFLRVFSFEDISIAIAAAMKSGWVEFGNCGWCRTYDFSLAANFDGAFTSIHGAWDTGVGWGPESDGDLSMQFDYPVSEVELWYSTPDGGDIIRITDIDTNNDYSLGVHLSGFEAEIWTPGAGEGALGFRLDFSQNPTELTTRLSKLIISGGADYDPPPGGSLC